MPIVTIKPAKSLFSMGKMMKPVVLIVPIIIILSLNQKDIWSFPGTDHTPTLQVTNLQSPLLSKTETDVTTTELKPALQSLNLTLKLAFMADPRLFPYELECHVQEKSIELTGVVSREEEKTLATQLTKILLTGKEIQNNIQVQPSLSAKIQTTVDTRLTDLVKQRFAKSQTLRETNFEVSTLRGVVSLSGQTRFQVIVFEAAQAARDIPGVMAVNTQNIRLEAEND
jgi:hyperosmotically inducible periplasmic protein